MVRNRTIGSEARIKMHAEELDLDEALVVQLVALQFPHLAELPIQALHSTGTVNVIYRLGDDLYVRLPRVPSWAESLEKEWNWLPKLAPWLSLRIPEPVALGQPTSNCPFPWAIYRLNCAESMPTARLGPGANRSASWTL